MAGSDKDGWKEAGGKGRNVLGSYTILRKLGAGAMGEVYEAQDGRTGAHFALKLLPKELTADPEKVTRFVQEAKTVSKLSHKGIVGVHGLDRDRGRLFFVMDLVDGETLDAVLKRGEIGVVQAAKYALQASAALAHAHQQGIVHRDIKPANLMIDKERNLFLTDFGVAKLEGRGGITAAGSIIGTPNYMSPEQARGDLERVDARSDVYSLGATFYEMLTRAAPFTAENPNAVLRKVIEDDPIPPSRINGRVPRALELICLKALRKAPAKRYATAGEMAADLQRWLDGKPVAARPESAGDRAAKWIRRHRGFTLGSAALAVVALAILLALSSLSASARTAAEEAARRKAEKAAALVEKGNALLEADRIEAARKRFREALAVEEDHAGAQVGLERTAALEKEIGERARERANRSRALALAREAAPVGAQVTDLVSALLDNQRKKGAFYRDNGDDFEGSNLNEIEGAIARQRKTFEEKSNETLKGLTQALLLDPNNEEARGALGALLAAHLRLALYAGRRDLDYTEARRLLADVKRYNVNHALDEILAAAGTELGWRRQVRLSVEPYDTRVALVPWDRATGIPGRETSPGATEFYLDPGSYVLVFRSEGYIEARVPVFVPPFEPDRILGPLDVAFSMVHEVAAPQGMILVPSVGSFVAGGPEGLRAGPTRIIAEGEVAAFFMDRTEVTNRQYAAFVQALRADGDPDAEKRVPAYADDPALNGPDLPVVGVSFEDAAAYASWAGKRLPSSLEWEKAARGADGRLFPWGDRFDETRCVHGRNPSFKTLSPVGSVPDGASPYGCLDMAGNAAEWTGEDFYGYIITRGGSFRDPFDILRTNAQDCTFPSSRHRELGFRCAKSLE